MIVWIASYPKSGNIWVRTILYSLLYSRNGNFKLDELEKIRPWKYIILKIANFFNLGKENDWKKFLDSKVKLEIDKKFSKELIELGYLTK